MPKSSNQKLKLIYLMKILLERTDETHGITMPEIIEALGAYDISAERKSLYNDIENLRVYGLDVIGTQEGRHLNHLIWLHTPEKCLACMEAKKSGCALNATILLQVL